MNGLTTLVFALCLCSVLVPALIRLAPKLGLVDLPNERKVHYRIVPRSGGIAIAIASLTPLVFLLRENPALIALFLSAIVIIMFGLLDDFVELNYRLKLLGQSMAVVIVLWGLPTVSKLPFDLNQLPPIIVYSVLFLFLLGCTNAVNLTDGLDGLAGGTSLLSLGLIAILAHQSEMNYLSISAMSVMGALLGFLRFNTHPAKVFMGDSGSQFLGFITAALAIFLTQGAVYAASPLLPLIILGLPILDTLTVICLRVSRGHSPFEPDKNHLHHQLLNVGFYHYEVVAILYILQIILVLSAYYFRYHSDLFQLLFYGVYISLISVLLYFARNSEWRFRPENHSGRDRRNRLLRRMTWLYSNKGHIITTCISLLWLLMVTTSKNTVEHIHYLSMTSLTVALVVYIFAPNQQAILTRICAYSASSLALYQFNMFNVGSLSMTILNIILIFIALILALSILITPKHEFSLDNQDILVLFLLAVTPLLPIHLNNYNISSEMLLQLAVMIYAIEYLLSQARKARIGILFTSAITLLIMSTVTFLQ